MKRLIYLALLTLSLAVAGIMTGFTLVGGLDPVQSNWGIDPVECDLVHNLAACDGSPTLEDPPLLSMRNGSATTETPRSIPPNRGQIPASGRLSPASTMSTQTSAM